MLYSITQTIHTLIIKFSKYVSTIEPFVSVKVRELDSNLENIYTHLQRKIISVLYINTIIVVNVAAYLIYSTCKEAAIVDSNDCTQLPGNKSDQLIYTV